MILRKPAFVLIVAVLAVAGWSGCRRSSNTAPPNAPARTIVDMAGRTVSLPATVDRVAANGMSLTQMLLLLGDDKKLVATMPSIQADAWYLRVFPHLAAIPAPFSGADVNIESLLDAHPQVVFLWTGTEALRDKIATAGIPVVTLAYNRPEDLKRAVALMARVMGSTEETTASKFVSYYDDNLRRVLAKTSTLPASRRLRVYYVAGTPLNSEGKNSIVNAWIEAAGGVNVVAASVTNGIVASVSMEDVLHWNPEAIVVRDANALPQIAGNPQWKSVDAIRNRRIYVNPKGVNVWSARSGDGALQLLWAAKTLHPELFPEIDMKTEVRSFYAAFYRYSLSNQELECVMQGAPPPR